MAHDWNGNKKTENQNLSEIIETSRLNVVLDTGFKYNVSYSVKIIFDGDSAIQVNIWYTYGLKNKSKYFLLKNWHYIWIQHRKLHLDGQFQ